MKGTNSLLVLASQTEASGFKIKILQSEVCKLGNKRGCLKERKMRIILAIHFRLKEWVN